MGYNDNGGYGCCNGGFPFMNGMMGGFGYEWIIMLLFFGMFGWGGGGFGFGGGRGLEQATTTAAETAALVGQQQVADRVASINTGVDAVAGIATANGVKVETVKDLAAAGFAGVNTNLCELGNNIAQQFSAQTMNNMQNHNNLTSQLTEMRFANAQCCCDTKQLIQSGFCDLRHDVMQAIANSEASLKAEFNNARFERMQDKLNEANERNSALKAQIDNSNQTQTLLAAIQQQCGPRCAPVACAPACSPCAPCYDGVQRAVNDALGARIGELLFPATATA